MRKVTNNITNNKLSITKIVAIIVLFIILFYVFYVIKENFENENNDYGFIITRHVNSEETNKYWNNCVKCIRKFYKNEKIVIIDDNSDSNFLKNLDTPLDNCIIVQSEFPKRGELLPYYYLHKNKYFKKAIVIHDSIFFIKYIDFNKFDSTKFLFHFTHQYNDDNVIIPLLKKLNDSDNLIQKYNEKKWYMCFGVQSCITLDLLEKIENKYNFFVLLEHIDSREKRMALERIFGLL